jgi:hypothetical protein
MDSLDTSRAPRVHHFMSSQTTCSTAWGLSPSSTSGSTRLEQLPSFTGLVNLKALALAVFVSLPTLPAFDSLHNLERLVMSFLPSIDSTRFEAAATPQGLLSQRAWQLVLQRIPRQVRLDQLVLLRSRGVGRSCSLLPPTECQSLSRDGSSRQEVLRYRLRRRPLEGPRPGLPDARECRPMQRDALSRVQPPWVPRGHVLQREVHGSLLYVQPVLDRNATSPNRAGRRRCLQSRA